MEKLTKGQKEALEAVRTGRNVCITGGGGVGKSYISRKIIEDLQKQGKRPIRGCIEISGCCM